MFQDGSFPNELVEAEREYKQTMYALHECYVTGVRLAWDKYQPILDKYKTKMPIVREIYNGQKYVPINTKVEEELFDD